MAGSRPGGCGPSCSHVRAWLPEYDYGGPTVWRRWRVTRHLAACPECARELAALRQATALLDTLDRRAPEDLWERVCAAIERTERAPAPRSAVRRMPALATGAIALALAAGVGLWRAREPEPPSVRAEPYVQMHLALLRTHPLAPGAGIDTLLVRGGEEHGP